jgi:hypothetical protein
MSDRKRITIAMGIITLIWAGLIFSGALLLFQTTFTGALVMTALFTAAMIPIWIAELALFNFFHKRAFKGKSKDSNTSPRQSKTIEIDLPYQEAFELCQEGIQAITGSKVRAMGFTHTIKARIKKADAVTGKIIGKTRAWLWIIPGFYEDMRITLNLEQTAPGVTRIHIDNRPVLPSVVFDWGYGLNNVNVVALYLRQQAYLHNAESHLVESSSDDVVVELDAIEKQETLP